MFLSIEPLRPACFTRRSVAAGFVASLLCFAVVLSASGPPDERASDRGALVMEFPRYNTEYRGLVAELQAVDAGGLTVELTSPEHELTVLGHRLSLWAGKDGLHDARLEATFRGSGELIAEVRMGSFPARLDDRVTILEQSKIVDAVVRVVPDPEGYMVTLEERPDSVDVAIESELADGLVSLCGGFSLFLGSRAACDGLETLLNNPRVPMPEPGTEFLVHRDYFTEAERARIDGFLGFPTEGTERQTPKEGRV